MGIEDIRKIKSETSVIKPKKVYYIPKKSKKRLAAEAEIKKSGEDSELVKWYRARMKHMGNRCNECGCKVENKIYQYAIMSICHLLPKRDNMCPSVKTNPLNWITLCPDHHNMFDNASWEQRELMGCWETVRDRLIMVYPNLDPSEHRHFPESVLKYMQEKEPFV